MSTTQIFDPKSPSEVLTLAFEFLSRVPVGVTISSSTVTASVFSGDDDAPEDLLDGASTHSGTAVSQGVTGGIIGNIYNLVCAATLSNGDVLEISGYLAIAEACP